MTTFRIDDIGASTKLYNQHAKEKWRFFPFANFWFFKIVEPFRGWAKYEELTAFEWNKFLDIFNEYNIRPIIAVTACWVEKDGRPVPFPEKFPEQAAVLKKALKDDKIEIANHGLTHCVVGRHRPKFWGSNRRYHREFWPWLPKDVHEEHIVKSQGILESYFESKINILVPPGNVWSTKTCEAMKGTNLDTVLCNRNMMDSDKCDCEIKFVDDRYGYFNFHDRELKLYGGEWLVSNIKNNL